MDGRAAVKEFRAMENGYRGMEGHSLVRGDPHEDIRCGQA